MRTWPSRGCFFDSMCGKRLKVAIADNLEALRDTPELTIRPERLARIAAMSAVTLDRRLRSRREKDRLKGLGHTKPTTALKARIPIRTGSE